MKKLILSLGLELSNLERKVEETESDVPGSFHYRVLFEVCASFSSSLHDCHWPCKRDSRDLP